jgi:hypothetical protein
LSTRDAVASDTPACAATLARFVPIIDSHLTRSVRDEHTLAIAVCQKLFLTSSSLARTEDADYHLSRAEHAEGTEDVDSQCHSMTTIVESSTERLTPAYANPVTSLGRFHATVAIATGME